MVRSVDATSPVSSARGIAELCKRAQEPSELLFWTGAGISRPAPACAPAGAAMTEALLERYFEPGTLETIQHYYRVLDVEDLNSGLLRTLPRFETVLQIVADEYGPEELMTALSPIAAGQPNDNHLLFAAHLEGGGRHITANFDDYIEQAGASPNAAQLLHFHGVLGEPRLGATIGNIEQGLLAARAEIITNWLQEAQLLVVCGYSGSDYFDIDPLLASFRPAQLRGLTIVWVDHADGVYTARRVTPDDRNARRQMRWLTRAGADCWDIRAPTSEVVREVCALVGVHAGSADSAVVNPWWTEAGPPEERQRSGTLRMYSWLGLCRDVLAMEHQCSASPVLDSALAEALFAAGRFREARRHWRRAFRGSDVPHCYARSERSIAVSLSRGQLLWALLKLEFADTVYSRTRVQLPLWQLAEHRTKGLDAMTMSPELRWIATRRRRDRAALRVRNLQVDDLGVEARVRLSAAARRLDATSATNGWIYDLDDSTVSLGEAERLGAVINYRHAKLRRDLSSSLSPGLADAKARIATHLRHQLLLGMTGDAARTAMLRHAEQILTHRQVMALNRLCDLTLWHRARIGVFDSLRRLGARRASASSSF